MNLTGAIGSVFLIRRIGRRGLIYAGLGSQIIILLFLQLGVLADYKILSLILIYTFVIAYSLSLGATLYVYQTEILPPEVIPIVSGVQWSLTFMVSFSSLHSVSNDVLFLLAFLFFFTSLIGCFIFQGYSVETKGKSDSKIINDWKRKTFTF